MTELESLRKELADERAKNEAIKKACADAAENVACHFSIKVWTPDGWKQGRLAKRYINYLRDAIMQAEPKEIEADRAPERDGELREALDQLLDFADEVRQWSEAYPTKIFQEPTPEEAHKVCESLGVTLDCFAAMILRQFTKPWGDKASALLARYAEKPKE